jgi:anaerobic selenocysteine-containing dehydrogenase
MLNVIVSEERYDKEFVAQWTAGFEQLAKHVERFTPEWAQSITRLRAIDIREVARTYATTKPALIHEGNAIDQYPNAVQTARAIGILTAITGNLDIEGGNVFFPRPTLSPLVGKTPTVKCLGADKYPLYGRTPFPCFVDAALSGKPYIPRAMIVYHANPVLVDADSTRTRQALEKLELLVVCDIFKSATAELADIILPDASEFERCDFQCYGSTRGGFIALRQKVIEPVGESRPVFEIEYELSKKMGLESAYPWTDTEEWINHRLKASGITIDDLKKQPIIYTTPPIEYRKYLRKGFNTPSGKVEIYSQRLQDYGYLPLPEYRELDEAFASQPNLLRCYPLIGTTRRPGVYVHTRFRNVPMLRKLEPEALMRICPQDAQSRGIKDGDFTIVRSPKGSIEVKARVTDEVSVGVVIIDFGWGNPWDSGPNVNVLTNDEDRDLISCSTTNRRFRCQVSKVNPC